MTFSSSASSTNHKFHFWHWSIDIRWSFASYHQHQYQKILEYCPSKLSQFPIASHNNSNYRDGIGTIEIGTERRPHSLLVLNCNTCSSLNSTPLEDYLGSFTRPIQSLSCAAPTLQFKADVISIFADIVQLSLGIQSRPAGLKPLSPFLWGRHSVILRRIAEVVWKVIQESTSSRAWWVNLRDREKHVLDVESLQRNLRSQTTSDIEKNLRSPPRDS